VRCLRLLLPGLVMFTLAACSPDRPATPPEAPGVSGEIVGTNAEIDNGVDLRSAAEPDWRAAELQGPVRYADAVRTGQDGRLVVALVDKARLTIGPRARITIDRFLIDTRPGIAGATVSVTAGAFRFVSGDGGGEPDAIRFDTPIATIGIRGTILEGAVGPDALAIVAIGPMIDILTSDPSTATLIVLREGIIEVRIGQTVVVLDVPGQAMVLAGGRWSQPFLLSRDAGARLDGLLAPQTGRPKAPKVVDRPRPAPEPEPPPAATEQAAPADETPPPAEPPPPPPPIRPDDRRAAPARPLPASTVEPADQTGPAQAPPQRRPAPKPAVESPPSDPAPPRRP